MREDRKHRILHITNWYPNLWNSIEGQFIREQYGAVPAEFQQELWHVQVRHEGSLFRLHSGSHGKNVHYLILDTKIRSWQLIELLTLGLLFLLRLKLRTRSWELVNMHIAYPLLRFPKVVQLLFGRAIVVSEHWSAYKSGFHLKEGSRAKRRIQNIFGHGVPLITVSEALAKDVVEFSGRSDYRRYVITNIVDPELFYPSDTKSPADSATFSARFMIDVFNCENAAVPSVALIDPMYPCQASSKFEAGFFDSQTSNVA